MSYFPYFAKWPPDCYLVEFQESKNNHPCMLGNTLFVSVSGKIIRLWHKPAYSCTLQVEHKCTGEKQQCIQADKHKHITCISTLRPNARIPTWMLEVVVVYACACLQPSLRSEFGCTTPTHGLTETQNYPSSHHWELSSDTWKDSLLFPLLTKNNKIQGLD